MIISRVILKNWRNFRTANVRLGNRVFVVGPNASGKSNLLDVFRFLRDIAKPGGSLRQAVEDRGGISKIRCLSARQYPDIEIEIHLSQEFNTPPIWKYALGIKQGVRGRQQGQPYLAYERVWEGENKILDRPNELDKEDEPQLAQTYLEQLNVNKHFRKISEFLESVLYLHLVPQLLRYPKAFSGPGIPGDPFGRDFLERIAKTPEKTKKSRLKKIEQVLKIAVPQLRGLSEIRDEAGIPHMEVVYEHWRSQGAKQQEDQFSDGTLRLLGLLWTLLEGNAVLLMEEPELSLNAGIVKKLPTLIYKMQKDKKKEMQVMLSTHSYDLLSDPGIAPEEVVLLVPKAEGTAAKSATDITEVRALLEGGMSIGEVVLPHAVPKNLEQLKFFE